MINKRFKSFAPVTIFFVILTSLLLTFRKTLTAKGFDVDVVLIGNILLFLITLFSFVLGLKGLNDPNPHAFVRTVMGGMMLKLFTCIIAAFIYIYLSDGAVNKAALFSCMGLYLVYTFMEVTQLLKMMKQKPS